MLDLMAKTRSKSKKGVVLLPEGAVQFPEPLWRALSTAAAGMMIPVDVLVMAEMARWCRDHRDVVAPTPVVVVKDLPEDIERSGSSTGFRGVYPNGNGFKAILGSVVIGTFATKEEAALARYQELRSDKDRERAAKDKLLESQLAVDPDAQAVLQGPPPVSFGAGAHRYKCPLCFTQVRGSCPKCGSMEEAKRKVEENAAAVQGGAS